MFLTRRFFLSYHVLWVPRHLKVFWDFMSVISRELPGLLLLVTVCSSSVAKVRSTSPQNDVII